MMPSGLVESLPTASFFSGMPKRITPPTPRSRICADFLDEQIGRQLIIARHRGDFLPYAAARPDEQRHQQFGRRESRRLHKLPHGRVVRRRRSRVVGTFQEMIVEIMDSTKCHYNMGLDAERSPFVRNFPAARILQVAANNAEGGSFDSDRQPQKQPAPELATPVQAPASA